MPDELGSMEVAEAAGIAYQQLWRWYDAGAVRPAMANGRRLRWSELDQDALSDIATVVEDLAVLELPMSTELVTRIWDACHDDPDADVIEIAAGTVTVTVDRRDRRAVQTLRHDSRIRRGLEEA